MKRGCHNKGTPLGFREWPKEKMGEGTFHGILLARGAEFCAGKKSGRGIMQKWGKVQGIGSEVKEGREL